ncbi:MAG: CopG family ribbon-helix-helix protein [Alphaproteobacteria bacterium]
MTKTTIRAEIDANVLERFDALCRSWERSQSEVIEEAVVGYLDWNDRQMAHIRAGIAEADRGELVPHAEVVAMFRKWRDRCE